MDNQQDQQNNFQDYIVTQLLSIVQSDQSYSSKCQAIIQNQFSPFIFQELINTIICSNNLYNRNPTPELFYQCSEIFQNANQDFIDYIFDITPNQNDESQLIKKNLFRTLISVVECDTLNETICGYLYKAMNSCIQKRGTDVWNYLENDSRIISSLIKHVDQPYICRIITELIIFGYQPQQLLDYSYKAQQISNRLFKMMIYKSHSNLIVDNISNIFIEIFQRKQQNPNLEISKILETFQHPKQLFDLEIQSNSKGPYSILNLLLEYIINYQQDQLELLFLNVLKLIPQQLKVQNYQKDNYFGKLFGSSKMALILLTFQLIQLKNVAINSELIQQDFADIFINIALEFPLHQQLHHYVFWIFKTIIDSDQPESISKIIDSLLNFIIEQLSNQQKQNQVELEGFVSQLAKYLIDRQNNVIIGQAMKQNQQWKLICQTTLKNINQIEQSFLFNFNPNCKILDQLQNLNQFEIEQEIKLEQQKQQQLLLQEQQQIQQEKLGQNEQFN
ncbi:unnamed protein product [Paramecium sonneborni]|uniref:Uncharacterized protein n=1 Tax=Paramecium sonneborni TaxID=65129 RepID=A0A8S1NWX4_9CILI|nr:unnamed protein product [Paramecium sonneborni]